MSTYEVEVRRVIVVEAGSPYSAVGKVIAGAPTDLTEVDVHEVRERVPQPAYLTVSVVPEAWQEATNDAGDGLGYPEMEKDARR